VSDTAKCASRATRSKVSKDTSDPNLRSYNKSLGWDLSALFAPSLLMWCLLDRGCLSTLTFWNSTVENFCRKFFDFEAKPFFFSEKTRFSVGWLVGWLDVYNFHICRSRKLCTREIFVCTRVK